MIEEGIEELPLRWRSADRNGSMKCEMRYPSANPDRAAPMEIVKRLLFERITIGGGMQQPTMCN
jgi:hypothetical protein